MAQDFYTYDPKDLIILVGGVPVLASGPVVIARNNDRTSEQVGQTGDDICINVMRNKTGTVTIPVKAQSTYDVAFDTWSANAPAQRVPFQIFHKSTNKVMATTSWYKTQPDLSFGEEVELRGHMLTLEDASFDPISAGSNLYDQFQTLTDTLGL